MKKSVLLLLILLHILLQSCTKEELHLNQGLDNNQFYKNLFEKKQLDKKLILSVGVDENVHWEPNWDNPIQKFFPSGNKYIFIPLIAKLYNDRGLYVREYAMANVRNFLLVEYNDTITKFSAAMFLYDDKRFDNYETFIEKFTGVELITNLEDNSTHKYIYRDGAIQNNVNASPGKNSKKGQGVFGANGTNGFECKDIYTCYWSAYCDIDGVVYGTVTSGEIGCSLPPFTAGSCAFADWVQTSTDITQECYFDDPDVGGGLPPGGVRNPNLPCPGDAVIGTRIAPSGNGNIPGGTYGYTRTYPDGTKKFHDGIDIAATPGTLLVAAQTGVVTRVRSSFYPGKYAENSYGNFVEIRNLDGTYFKYNHMDTVEPNVIVGAKVNQGGRIGTTGTTGNASKKSVLVKHLHLQMKDANYQSMDPQPHISTKFDKQTGIGERPC